jgi:LytS/YehU family sensor histidine kinase
LWSLSAIRAKFATGMWQRIKGRLRARSGRRTGVAPLGRRRRASARKHEKLDRRRIARAPEHRSAQLKQSELARALQLAELRLLKSQLNPHFLFNALNTVRSLIADNPERAQNAVTRLAKALRYNLTSPQDELVTLSQELDIVSDYLELESMRFEDRLRIQLHVPDDAAGVHIPVMLLQTLVENAIKHGIAQLPSGGLVRVCATVQSKMLVLEVENPRPPAPVRTSQEGVGLQNARDRLRLLFGARASLELDLSQPSVTTARLRIPVNP